ncbi:imidazole glycerol phosphate synthase subunit HisH [Hwanghaeella grinnelliae]|uniref:Imidazole glycerol phosphate synthase subunit HisH n=1 Tax=Hwanghaeella grinnelliae TaxID=2500179 RepID=A0A437QQF5_9PROT|nr:imidazole glycerol phosphate synthase subunit HisH [Hwanghaeella grinnelliae]RVU36766.1 imidazole glycerol phosphate synthase subunit HisH [Hwanghaeella grinnelliae]
MSVVSVIDYGAGNISSVSNAIWYAGADVEVISTPDEVAKADRLVLPGVGAAGTAMARLRSSGLMDALREMVFDKARPFLGICIGMQVLAEELEEYGAGAGFGWVPGTVQNLKSHAAERQTVPHIGWKAIEVNAENPLSNMMSPKGVYYFCHSFGLFGTPLAQSTATLDTFDGCVAAIGFDTVVGTQFHPEKSQNDGIQFLESFLAWKP